MLSSACSPSCFTWTIPHPQLPTPTSFGTSCYLLDVCPLSVTLIPFSQVFLQTSHLTVSPIFRSEFLLSVPTALGQAVRGWLGRWGAAAAMAARDGLGVGGKEAVVTLMSLASLDPRPEETPGVVTQVPPCSWSSSSGTQAGGAQEGPWSGRRRDEMEAKFRKRRSCVC